MGWVGAKYDLVKVGPSIIQMLLILYKPLLYSLYKYFLNITSHVQHLIQTFNYMMRVPKVTYNQVIQHL